MAKITRDISDMISNYLYIKYDGDRIHVMRAHKEIASFMSIYGDHISKVHPHKATPIYCFGEWCFNTVSRAILFRSIYPDIAELLITEIEIPKKIFGAKIEVLVCVYTPGSPRKQEDEEPDYTIYSKIYTREFDDTTYTQEPGDTLDTWLSRTSKIIFDECVRNEYAQLIDYYSGLPEEELYDTYDVGICEFEEKVGFKDGIKIISTSDTGEIKTGIMAYPSFKKIRTLEGIPQYRATR